VDHVSEEYYNGEAVTVNHILLIKTLGQKFSSYL